MIKIFSLIAAIITTLILVCYHILFGITVDISKYKGDGKIKKYGAGIIEKGFRIEFDDMRIDNHKYYGKYRIDELPILDKKYVLYLRVKDKYDGYINKAVYAGKIYLKVNNGVANIIDINNNLSSWTMTSYDSNYFYFYSVSSG